MIDDFDKIYEGTEPYLFISYSHQDNDRVIPVIHGLQELGYRVWYDTGIAGGSRWPDIIAEHVMKSSCVIAFLSRNAMKSDYCQEEIFFALEEHRPIIPVYLEETILPPGLRMRLRMLQAIDLYRFQGIPEFLEKLTTEAYLQPSLGKIIPPETPSLIKPVQQSESPRRSQSASFIEYRNKKLISAVDMIMSKNQVSYSLIRQHLRTGYYKTLSIVDEMVSLGIIAPFDGLPNGRILITPQEWSRMKTKMKLTE